MPVLEPVVNSLAKTGSTQLQGDITLTGGSNVTLTQSGQDISIAATGGSGSPDGADTYVQFNDGGTSFGGTFGLRWDKALNNLSVNVGVSSTAPANSIFAVSASGTHNDFFVTGDGTFTRIFHSFGHDDSDGNASIDFHDTNSSNAIKISLNSAHDSYFLNNVGFGTTTPSDLIDVKGYLRLTDSGGAAYVKLKSANSGTPTFTLPASDGSSGQILKTDGSGNLSFFTAPNGSIGGSISGGTTGSILFVDGSTQLAQDNANFFWDLGNKRLGIGMNSPQWKLHIHDTTTSNVLCRMDGSVTHVSPLQEWGNTTYTSMAIYRTYLALGAANYVDGSIQFQNGTNNNTVSITSGAVSSNFTLTLPIAQGAAGTTLINNGSGVLSWLVAGDAVGPGSATDNAICRFDTTTGKLIQNSGATIDDSGNITGNNLSGTNTGDHLASFTVYAHGSISMDTAYQPNDTTHDVLVVASIQLNCLTALDDGKVESLTDASNPPSTVVGTVENDSNSGDDIVVQLTFVCKAGNYFKFKTTQVAGSPTFSVIGNVMEYSLT